MKRAVVLRLGRRFGALTWVKGLEAAGAARGVAAVAVTEA